ncbi:ly6/PLAUR domain-containing protein 6-like [Coregonus clupeaformis]|uniref:ly6/PLAUR domain-containing protein 6-like n=1 Tax=Coregonus clupeaformis TaxID=59861 RepID=UPI001BE03768|nr:ly6/PLAUR domain-containing protein 6-like [Coregonus clupeaformis]
MMEAWPAAWVLLLMLIADWLEAAQSRDFTVKDIILLHASTTPYPGGFKCFTCKDAPDNYQCNRWAPDLYCPRDSRYCYTRHMMDVQGNTVSVTKRCAALDHCLSTGCTQDNHEGYKVCTACCEGNICNMQLPRNKTDTIFSTTSPLHSSNGQLTYNWLLTGCLSSTVIRVMLSNSL